VSCCDHPDAAWSFLWMNRVVRSLPFSADEFFAASVSSMSDEPPIPISTSYLLPS